MLIMVTGGAASGKSAHAERILCEHAHRASRLYIATMQPFGKAAAKRIERHRELRAGKGFETAERYTDLAGLHLSQRYEGALLEDLSNLLANERFSPEGAGVNAAVQAVVDGVAALAEQVDTLVVVANEIFSDGVAYAPETTCFVRQLAAVNKAVAERADVVLESVCGILLTVREEQA